MRFIFAVVLLMLLLSQPFAQDVEIDTTFTTTEDNPFLIAAAAGDLAGVAKALAGNVDVNTKNARGWTATLYAVHNSHADVVDLVRLSF